MKSGIESIHIYDFDGTLCRSPENTKENRDIWEAKTGHKWPYGNSTGWWSKIETLNYKVFDIKLNDEVAESAIRSIQDPTVLSVILTGRMPKFSPFVKEICRRAGVPYFDRYYFNDSHNTLQFKLNKIEELAEEFPEAGQMEMWEDRREHITEFVKFGESIYGKDFKMNIISSC